MKTPINHLNEITVSYEMKKLSNKKIVSAKSFQTVLRDIYECTKSKMELKEYFFIVLLNRSNEPIGYYRLSEGGIAGTVADIRIAFATALKSLASGIILCHNHPSGNLEPSAQDIALTQRFKEAGQLLDISILDHIILTKKGHYSFADDDMFTII